MWLFVKVKRWVERHLSSNHLSNMTILVMVIPFILEDSL